MARLGMTKAEIEQVNDLQVCEVSALYDASGQAVRLETNWGAACRVTGHIQVGMGAGLGLHTPEKPA